jgi:ethanolamine utilization protein EutQ (cupin superfamily)
MKKAKPSRIGARKFSCVKCGELFDASPPDDVFTIGNLLPQLSTSKVIIEYECANHHKTTIYWTAPPTPRGFAISKVRHYF